MNMWTQRFFRVVCSIFGLAALTLSALLIFCALKFPPRSSGLAPPQVYEGMWGAALAFGSMGLGNAGLLLRGWKKAGKSSWFTLFCWIATIAAMFMLLHGAGIRILEI
jgi:hypothetical protein